MSKRIIAMIIAVVLAAALVGCGQPKIVIPEINSPSSVVDNGDSNPVATQAVDNNVASSSNTNINKTAPVNTGNNKVADGLEINAIPYSDDYGNYVYLLVTNKTGKDIDVKATVDFLGADGKLVDYDDGYIDCVANGTTVCMDYLDCGDKEYATFEYKVTYEEINKDYYAAVDQDLTMEVTPAEDKVIVSLTNNGKIPAKYVWFHAFFYNKGVLVDVENSYCEDDDSEIKPGATERGYDYFYSSVEGVDSYDDVKVYFHGEGSVN
ncbi:MAG: hypothetical protein IJV48_00635 [Ruminococcus sp.]|nr:hypothetical protein [Ruminococcus sp.]